MLPEEYNNNNNSSRMMMIDDFTDVAAVIEVETMSEELFLASLPQNIIDSVVNVLYSPDIGAEIELVCDMDDVVVDVAEHQKV